MLKDNIKPSLLGVLFRVAWRFAGPTRQGTDTSDSYFMWLSVGLKRLLHREFPHPNLRLLHDATYYKAY
jgi:hypothetical protein